MQKEEELQRIKELVAGYPAEERYALAIMQDMQRELSYVPHQAMPVLAAHIGAPQSRLYAMATFYKALSLTPKGRHVIKVCDGTACHMRGNFTLIKGVEAALGIRPGQTTPDGMFSLELVNCLGSCALAPVMVVDDVYHSQVSYEMLTAVIEALRTEEQGVAQ